MGGASNGRPPIFFKFYPCYAALVLIEYTRMALLCRNLTFAGALLGVLVGFFAGCRRETHPTKPGVYISAEKVVGITELSDSDPVLFVNGEKITRRDFEAELLLRDGMWRIANKLPFDMTKEELDEFRLGAGQGIMLQLIHHALFRQYAREKGIVPSEEKVKAAAEELLSNLGRKKSTVERLASEIGGDAGDLFRKIPYINAQDALLRRSVATNDLENVTDAEIKEREEFVAKFDANAEAMNAKAKARLNEARARILAGADIAEEAKKIFDTVNPQYAVKWGTFTAEEIPADEDLSKWLKKASPGDISEPLDVDDGLAIVKVVAKTKGDAPFGVEPPDAYVLVRCTVKACEKMRYQNREQMKKQLLLWKQEDAQRILGTMLTDRAVIEYPNGTNLFDKVAASAAGGEK